MNTRGLVEIIVLNLGIQSGILNSKVFTVMVIMCLVTTFMTCPLVNYVFPEEIRALYLEDEEDLIDKQDGTAFTMHTYCITNCCDCCSLQLSSFLDIHLL